jgi:predicted NUDIX family NTP pyrophosphohydrolase
MDAMAIRVSAGILLYRRTAGRLETLLAHPGGPLFASRDEGYWSIPKGEPDDIDEPLLDVARREFAEETGHPVPAGPVVGLGSITQKGGKVVFAWAVEGDQDPAVSVSNTFEMEWPPKSGKTAAFPEIDRVAWFDPTEARLHIKETQIPFLERLESAVGTEG